MYEKLEDIDGNGEQLKRLMDGGNTSAHKVSLFGFCVLNFCWFGSLVAVRLSGCVCCSGASEANRLFVGQLSVPRLSLGPWASPKMFGYAAFLEK